MTLAVGCRANQSKQKPEAIVALTHDNEWCDHLPDVRIYLPPAAPEDSGN